MLALMPFNQHLKELSLRIVAGLHLLDLYALLLRSQRAFMSFPGSWPPSTGRIPSRRHRCQ